MIEELDFTEKLVWRENAEGNWILSERKPIPISREEKVIKEEIIEIDRQVHNMEDEPDFKIKEEDTVLTEMGKAKVSKVEGDKVFIKIGDSPDEIELDKNTTSKTVRINVIIVGKYKTYTIEQIHFPINKSFEDLKKFISDLISISPKIMTLYFKEAKVETETDIISDKEIANDENIYVVFKEAAWEIMKKSTSTDYTWTDMKNVIGFRVDTDIVVNGFGFFKNYYSTAIATYDFTLCEVENNNSKIIYTLNNIQVIEADSDRSTMITTPEIEIKANVDYHAYVIFKVDGMGTYYGYYYNESYSLDSCKFTFFDVKETGYRTSLTSGHLPKISFMVKNRFMEK